MKKELVVMSLGGSIMVPDDIDHEFVKSFIKLILRHTEKGKRFVIVTGGGAVCRRYIDAAKKVRKLNTLEPDWIGVYVTRLNAEFLRILFGKHAYESIVTDPRKAVNSKKPVIIGAGWKPGFSSDYDTIRLAKTFGVKRVANLSNIKYVYDKDPKKHPDAKPLANLTWREFLDITGERWSAGMNTPFDPLASKEAEKSGIEVAIMYGKDIDNIDAYLSGREFMGTVIK